MLRILKRIVAVVAGIYLAALAVLYVEQRELLFHRTAGRPMLNIAALEPRRSIVCFATADGVELRSWYFPPPTKGAPVVLFLHGNAGDIGNHLPFARFLIEADYGVLALEYRGYGGNPGDPSEAGLMADARAAMDFLAQQQIDPKRIVLFGESLGTGIAVAIAAERPVGAIMLRSPYTNIAEVAAGQFPYFPVRWLVRDRFDALSKVAAIHAPLFAFHGSADALIPIALGRQLYDAAPEPKTFLEIPGTGHDDVQTPAAEQAMLAFLAGVFPDRDPTPEPPPVLNSLANCGT